MPVEFIDLVQGEDVDVGLDVLHREEVAAYVEHGSAVGEHGLVADDAGRDLSVADQLLKASEPVQYRLRGRCRDCDAFFRDFQQILFGVESGSQPQRYGVFRCSGRDGRCGSRKGSDGAAKISAGPRSRSSVRTTGVRPVMRNDPFDSVTEAGRGTTAMRSLQEAWPAEPRPRG